MSLEEYLKYPKVLAECQKCGGLVIQVTDNDIWGCWCDESDKKKDGDDE